MKFPRLPATPFSTLGLLVGALWASNSQACSSEPVLSGVCIMAVPSSNDFDNLYQFADGRLQTIQQATRLFSLLGITYGGDGKVNFKLPDLRGRVIVGAGLSNNINYALGQTGGAASTTLTAAQLPVHGHALNSALSPIVAYPGSLSAATTLNGLSATTTLGTMAATATLAGVPFSAPGSSLGLNASTGPTASANPAGRTLGTTALAIYSAAGPSVAMAAGSISGTISGTLSGNVPVTFSGNPTTTVGGSVATTLSGAPSFSLSGATELSGLNTPAPVPTLLPALVLNYFIATGSVAIYPSYD